MRWALVALLLAGCLQPTDSDDGAPAASPPLPSTPAGDAGTTAPAPPPTSPSDGPGFGTLDRGAYGPDREARGLRVLDDEAAWAAFWDEMKAGQSDPPPRPEVDFGRRFVVAVLEQTRPSGGHSVAVDRVEGSAPYVVHATFTRPGDGCGTTAALTQPYHVVWVERVGDAPPRAELAATDAVQDCA